MHKVYSHINGDGKGRGCIFILDKPAGASCKTNGKPEDSPLFYNWLQVNRCDDNKGEEGNSSKIYRYTNFTG